MAPDVFQGKLLAWFDQYGRKDLPWQQPISAYRVWVSEIMLQQTQVATVIPYFEKFMATFPTLEALAAASLDTVLGLWAGLGYYARARNLHKSAQIIVCNGYFPESFEELVALPGIGHSTAGAILSIAFHKSQPILDGNVKRVLARCFAIHGWPGESAVSKQLWALSSQLTPKYRNADYTQAIMDLGATLCTHRQPRCGQCPLKIGCQAQIHHITHLLPTTKPSKTLPVKSTIFLVLSNLSGQVFLEKRPELGIWGGLWSFPEFTDLDSARQWCSHQGYSLLEQHLGETRRHTFSHYHLDYQPFFIKIAGEGGFIAETPQLWCQIDDIATLGLPAPIKQLLQQHFQRGIYGAMG